MAKDIETFDDAYYDYGGDGDCECNLKAETWEDDLGIVFEVQTPHGKESISITWECFFRMISMGMNLYINK